jgi:hypothetical protein
MRIILLSLTSLIILLVPQIAFASSDEEGTVTWFKGRITSFVADDPMLQGTGSYIEIHLEHLEGDTTSPEFTHESGVDGQIRVTDPNDDVKTYDFTTNEGTAFVDIDVPEDAPLGTYSYDITADNNEYESVSGTFGVVDHYESVD